ncbi:DUF58 domain-containing protein [Massilia sp. CF038]|uniref:DUF58 domain-containing protein n=1 Tax=Massilia sp. CF038 TaxID=1881045 RepID=UPI0009213DCA|nr:DUF58 domain-containing protein [Massilia sp. CF038]SHH15586.1 Uncharacterized conserved protein, DUF58 family, contains vWF domain [Massilia sp. CF038]
MFAAIKKAIRRRADKWLFQLRDAEPGEVFLNSRRVFIVPTGAGIGFAGLLVILLIASTNYNLGLGFVLTFAVGTCAVVDMHLTHRNLVKLRLLAGRAHPVFAGEDAQFELTLINRTKVNRYALWVDFLQAGEPRYAADVMAGSTTALTLSTPSSTRGWLRAPRVRIRTRFPLGLFNGWSYWQPDARVLVYPFPEDGAPPLPMTGAASEDGHGHAGHDDFAGIRSYQPGDALRHLAWRQIARLDPSLGGALATKHFEGGAIEELVLDFDAMPASLHLELRLSRMARWVLDAEQRALPYAFRMNGREFAPSAGAAHQAACLRALALHGIKEQP